LLSNLQGELRQGTREICGLVEEDVFKDVFIYETRRWTEDVPET
jgi:hypothetical protein